MFRRNKTPESDSKAQQEAPWTNGAYDDTTQQLFNLSRALARSPSGADLKLRCTEFDSQGSVTLVSGEFKKSELIAKYGLLPRDLRKIDSSVLPHILVRPTAILMNLLHLRVLIQSDRVLVFDAYGSTDSYTQSLFMYDLEGKLRQKPDPRNTSSHLPYEFRALEAVLISVTSGLEAEFALVREPVTHILAELEEDIDREKLRHLLIHSKKLGTFEQKARLVRDAIEDLLEADDDLSAMYLTENKKTGSPRTGDDHQEVEMLLEAYHKICDEIVEISGNLISNIRNTEEVVKAILDANRNQLMLLEIKFSIGTLGLAGGTLIAGLYGMNLENFIEDSNVAFGAVTSICFFSSGLICVYGMRKLRKMQKVRMWGERISDAVSDRRSAIYGVLRGGAPGGGAANTGGRGNWRNEAMEWQAMRAARLRAMNIAGPAPQNSFMGYEGSRNAGTAASGPVLWPGMEGLGMHKLDPNYNATATDTDTAQQSTSITTEGDYGTNSDADVLSDQPKSSTSSISSFFNGGKKKQSGGEPIVTIHDDVGGENAEAVRKANLDLKKGIVKRS